MTKNKKMKRAFEEDSSFSTTGSTMSISNASTDSRSSQIPGPSGLPIVGSMMEWEGPHTNLAWTKKFGPIYQVKMGPKNIVYLNDVNLVEKYLENREGEKFLGRPAGPAVIGNGLLFGSGEEWKKNKRAFMKAMHANTFMEHMEGSVQSELRLVMDSLNSQTNKTVKIGDVLLPACTSAIAGLLLGGTLPVDCPDRKQLLKVSRDMEGVDLNSTRTKIALKFPKLREPMSKLLLKEIVDFHGISRRLQRLLRQWIRQCRNGTLTPSHVPYHSSKPQHTGRVNGAPRKPPRLRIPADVLLAAEAQQQSQENIPEEKPTCPFRKDTGNTKSCTFKLDTVDDDSEDSDDMNKSTDTIDTSSSEESILTSLKEDIDIDNALRRSTHFSSLGFTSTAAEEVRYEDCTSLKFETPVTPLTEFQWNFTSRMSMNVKEDSLLKRIIDQPEFLNVSEENDHDMIQALLDLFFGGIPPVLASLEFTLMYLTQNTAMQALAQKEIDRIVGVTGEITWSMREVMPYVRACITEGHRLGSVTPSSLPHIATEDTQIEGYPVPKDTMVLASIISMHHDPKHYIDPEAFRPQRHLDHKKEFQKPESYKPFGIGARKCIGESMSEMQLFLYITNILRHFTLRPPAGKKTVNTDTHMRIARRLKDFRCVLEPRELSNQTS